MNTTQKKRRTSPAARRTETPAPKHRRKTGTADTPGRDERRRRIQKRRRAKVQNPPKVQRVIRPPQEEIPEVIYTPPKPLRRGRFLWKLVSMAAVVAAVFLGLSVFFRVDTITVAGADKYTPWMIRQASGVNAGDALLGIGESRVASRIISKLPYIDEVKVGVRFPGTVEIQVKELLVTYSIEDENGVWWLISSSGRAVEQTTLDKALGYTRAEGLRIRAPQPGQYVQAVPGEIIDPGDGSAVPMDQSDADAQLAALIGIMTELENSRIIGKVSVIDVTDTRDLKLEYPQLLTVLLGDEGDLGYKIRYLSAAMDKLEANQSGELDLSFAYNEDAIFTPAR
jgi:hypothetical protein